MCIGIPMQVALVEPGHAQCVGRGETRRVRTALVGEVRPGQWLLVFIDSAREHISPERAAEIDATLDLLQHAMDGGGAERPAGAPPAFELPSAMSATQLLALSGQSAPPANESAP